MLPKNKSILQLRIYVQLYNGEESAFWTNDRQKFEDANERYGMHHTNLQVSFHHSRRRGLRKLR